MGFMARTVTSAIKTKGDRLVANGKVTRSGHNTYRVEGDHGTHSVYLADAFTLTGRCDCMAGWECSHLYAAAVFLLSEPETNPAPGWDTVDPFEGLV